MVKAFIDPRCNIEYSAFYLEGLYATLGKENVLFDIQYFTELEEAVTLNFVIKVDAVLINYTIDYNDSPYINTAAYDWCSYYGKINLRQSFLKNGEYTKIINLPPGFGIRIWSLTETLRIAFKNYCQVFPKLDSIKKFFSSYIKQLRHLPLEAYHPGHSSPDYIFSINTLWFSNEWINTDETVNQMRLNFYKAVSALTSIQAEIGFVYSQKRNTNPTFQPYVVNKWIPKKEYLAKTQRSVVVFNTPAWDLCHGWKLGEYLALGKAILSTPFHNELPFSLEHETHIHFVSGSVDEIQQTVQNILTDTAYRSRLEQQSRSYYERYVQPKAVLQLLIGDLQAITA